MDPFFQNYMPQHALSRLAGWLANSEISWLKDALIRYFLGKYVVNMAEAQNEDPFSYPSYNAFFTRALKANARPIASGLYDFVSPVDGTVSQVGEIQSGRIIQAKGRHYSVLELLGGEKSLAHSFQQGSFITLYLAPHQYHRIHMPMDGQLSQMIYIPGRLFSVDPNTTHHVDKLFARNERVVSVFNTSMGRVCVVLVGAMIVGSIETVWAGTVNSRLHEDPLQANPVAIASVSKATPEIKHWHYGEHPIQLKRGEEMGQFKLGSTVIVLLEQDAIEWKPGLASFDEVLMGQSLGQYKLKNV